MFSSKERKLICLRRFDVKTFEKPLSKKVKYARIPGFKGKGMPENCTARCVGMSNDDRWIVVGMKQGSLVVIECDKSQRDLGMR